MTSDNVDDGHAWTVDALGYAWYTLRLAKARGSAWMSDVEALVGVVESLAEVIAELRTDAVTQREDVAEKSHSVETNGLTVNGWHRFEDSVYSMTRGIDLWLLSGREGPLWELTLHGPGSTVRDRAMGFSLGAATASARRFVNDHYAKATGPRVAGEDD